MLSLLSLSEAAVFEPLGRLLHATSRADEELIYVRELPDRSREVLTAPEFRAQLPL